VCCRHGYGQIRYGVRAMLGLSEGSFFYVPAVVVMSWRALCVVRQIVNVACDPLAI
jgi:hypothetical protein